MSRQKMIKTGIVLAALVSITLLIMFPFSSDAAQKTLEINGDDFSQGTTSYGEINTSVSDGSLQLQKGNVGTWDTSTSTGLGLIPSLVDGYTNMIYGPNDNLYLMVPFNKQCKFYRYDTEKSTSDNLSTPPIGCGAGSIMQYDGDYYIYYAPGGSSASPSNRFARYDIRNNSWEFLANFPSSISTISSGAYVKQNNQKYIYVFRGMSSPSFWRYSVAMNTWESMPSYPTSGNVGGGLAMAWDGKDTIYALSNYYGEFKKYSITTKTWTNLPSSSDSTDRRYMLAVVGGEVYATASGAEAVYLRVFNIDNNSWEGYTPSPTTNNYDYSAPIAYDGKRYVYTIIGWDLRYQLYRYDTIDHTWNNATLLRPQSEWTGYHKQLIFDNSNSLYYMGRGTERLYRYDTTTQQAELVDSQVNTNSGQSGVYSNGSLYLMPTSGSTFQRYDLTEKNFISLASLPYNANENGTSIVDGGDNYLYAILGGGSNRLLRYNLINDTWQSLASMPYGSGEGGGIERIGSSLYVLAGRSSGILMKYDMTKNAWSYVDNQSNGSISWGGFITGDGSRYLYIGTSSRIDATVQKVYRYDTVSDTWLRIADMPSGVQPQASAEYDQNRNILYVAQGYLAGNLWTWKPGTTSYVKEGAWYSKTYDLKQVQSWTSLNLDITEDNQHVSVYTRTSDNPNVWPDWQLVSGTRIASSVSRYLQIKIVLTGDGSNTPTLKGVTVSYTQETNSPELPSTFVAKDTKDGSSTLSSGKTYEHQHPFFSWSNASDGTNGSGIDGYYVYFGLDSGADPAVYGSYQSSLDYTVSTPMTAGDIYYLRIKVKDKLGNASDAATYFSYRYFYISPPNSIVKTSDEDFSLGSNTNVSISDGSISLKKQENGVWSTGSIVQPPDRTIGAAMHVVGESLYVVRGGGSTTFWRYDMVTQSWNTLAQVPSSVNPGSSMTYDNDGNLYLMAGGSTTNFYKYSIDNDTWQAVGGNLPASAQIGSDVTYIGNGRFIMLFSGVREFYMYDSVANGYTSLQSYPTTITNGGSGIWYDGNDTVYAYLGYWAWYNSRNSRNTMAKYSISSDSWKILADPPVIMGATQNNLVSDGAGNLYITGSNLYNDTTKNQRMLKYNIETDAWSEVLDIYMQNYRGSMTSDGQRYIYILPNGDSDSRRLIRYDTWNNISTPSSTSIDVLNRIAWDTDQNAWQWIGRNSSTSTYDGEQYIYAISGWQSDNSWSQFVKIDYKTGETIYYPSPPVIGLGGSLSYLDGYVYYVPAKSTPNLYRFDEPKGQWQLVSKAPTNISVPGAMSTVSVDGSIYVFRGAGSKDFYKYTPDSGSGNWEKMANSSYSFQYGSVVYDDDNACIYAIPANGGNGFMKYDIAKNTWSVLSNIPEGTSYGSVISISQGRIYIQIGNNTTRGYVYDIAEDSWSKGSDAPDTFRYGATIAKVSDTTAIAFGGEYKVDFWQFDYPTENTAYNGLATHVSESFSIAGLYDYASITAEVSIPTNTSVEMWTRTSSDEKNWSEWSIASNVKKYNNTLSGIVTSIPKKYTQVKLVLESNDNLYTPVVLGYTLSYYFDVDPPSNPTTLVVYNNKEKSDELENNTWYNYNKPLFDWPDAGEAGGPTDGPLGSNIAGYWMYVGTDPTASPRTQGVFVDKSEYNPTLTIPGSYYVRIQTQDVTGNIDGDIFSPFIYKFDNKEPTNPALITVTPSGFSSKNNYTFVWPNGYDGNSGIAGYCYHTGATSGPFADEVCQTGTSLENVSAAYRSGTNVFYVRAYDIAGNYASSYTTVSFYYSTDPPSAVTNLRAIPPTSTQNLFAFTWDLPLNYSGDPDQITYCYSVNNLPTPTNTTCTKDRYIAAFKAATQRGTNIIYMAAKDEAGNINWNTFASANYIANTVSPGIPLNLIVADTSDRVSSRWTLTLTWNAPLSVGNGIKDYVIERSTDGHTFDIVGKTNSKAYVDLDIDPETTYYYRVRAEDEVDNVGGASAVVSKSAQGNFAAPPTILISPTVTADFDRAKISWVTNRESSSFVYYGTSPSNLSQSKGSLEPTASHGQTITGLKPSTTYYYRVQSFDDNRNYDLNDAYSDIFSFRTTASAQVENVSSVDITSSSAVITWSTSVPTKARVSYGVTQNYGIDSDDGIDEYSMTHTIKLVGLSGGTKYHFRITSTTSFGSSFSSDNYNFETIAQPYISNIRFQPIVDGVSPSVQVSWSTNVPTSSTVRYSAYGTQLEESLSALTTNHSITLESLASDTDYQVYIEGRDQYGNLAASQLQNWTTAVDTRPPDINDVSYNVITTDSGSNKKAQIIIYWTTDEPATSQVAYGSVNDKSLSKKTTLDPEATANHVVIISGLNLAEVYKVQIVTRDLDGNTSYGSVATIVTPDKDTSVFDNVLDLMLGMFSFRK